MANTTITPHLACRNAAEAYEFYQKAFGAEGMMLMKLPDGRVMHGAISIDGASIYLCDEFPEHGGKSPLTLGGSPVTIHLQVEDCDALFNKAVAAGCTVMMPMDEAFWGDRYGMVKDPYGHSWSIATTVKAVAPEELEKAAAEAMASMESGEGCQVAA